MTGEFPIFQKGSNTLSWNGTVESVSVKNYSRWI